ncbi:hypothetical protein D3C72_1736770 [compost metagenome]
MQHGGLCAGVVLGSAVLHEHQHAIGSLAAGLALPDIWRQADAAPGGDAVGIGLAGVKLLALAEGCGLQRVAVGVQKGGGQGFGQ